ncbi:hypothetical protein GDO81_016454 [Engystomops pustulosus]|uniref:Uncharacterized protein n=1 Tax=Engystomops pustulosus TaxID=76066 RepID=A0AAV7AT40_ENGPU|nr:hypothetical protein GDO81_016454 [Engystomops pustulosus]
MGLFIVAWFCDTPSVDYSGSLTHGMAFICSGCEECYGLLNLIPFKCGVHAIVTIPINTYRIKLQTTSFT